ncbi:MAG: hypothetical protein G8237_10260 [Magnetococcales bacterium]|nr:hypothetical protein [Magnetococcales bacterium]NGZ06728.1 hypothetical protein [Magnetococcales bacterium]
MKKDPKLDAWIALDDYILNGTRKPKSRIVHQIGKHPAPLPDTWVNYEDYLLHGVRKKHVIPEDEAFIDPLKPPPPPQEVPEEAYLTLFDALQEIWAVPSSRGAVFSRLTMMGMADLADWQEGRITESEFKRRQSAIEEIRLHYAVRAEEATEWFLNQRLRLFETLPNA